MALYIDDKKIVDLAHNEVCVGLIAKKITSYGHVVIIDYREKDVILIQTVVGDRSRNMYSNTVGISEEQIYVNPISDKNGRSIARQLKEFIETELISEMRDNRLNELGI